LVVQIEDQILAGLELDVFSSIRPLVRSLISVDNMALKTGDLRKKKIVDSVHSREDFLIEKNCKFLFADIKNAFFICLGAKSLQKSD
jgi:hypothetical protein